jgi:hypothetical protein
MAPTPGAPNDTGGGSTPEDCEGGTLTVKINEILPNPEGADDGYEFLELYNAGSSAVNLSAWGLDADTRDWDDSPDMLVPDGVIIEAGGFLVVGQAMVEDVDVVHDALDLGNASTAPDGVRLLDCAGVVQDTLLYGKSGEPASEGGMLDDAGGQTMGIAPSENKTLGRYPDGEDTDDCSADFVTDLAPTPGAPNATTGGGTVSDCVAGTQTIKVNEILPNPEGTDDNREFIELFNPSEATVSISGWGIRTATREFDDDIDFMFPEGATIAPGGFVVAAGLEVPVADFYFDDDNKFSLGNAGTAPDGVQLVDCEYAVQDTVLYGDAGDPPDDLALADDLGAQTMGVMPGEDFSVGRYPDGVDTNNNEEDLYTNMLPTPGEPNMRGGGGGDDVGEGCGCGGKDSEPGTGDGPSEASAGFAGLMALLAMMGLRRKDP